MIFFEEGSPRIGFWLIIKGTNDALFGSARIGPRRDA